MTRATNPLISIPPLFPRPGFDELGILLSPTLVGRSLRIQTREFLFFLLDIWINDRPNSGEIDPTWIDVFPLCAMDGVVDIYMFSTMLNTHNERFLLNLWV